MLPALNLDEANYISLDLRDPVLRQRYVRWERHSSGWRLRNAQNDIRSVVPLSLVEALAAPARQVWPAPATLPFTDRFGDTFDLNDRGELHCINSFAVNPLVLTSDVFALAAALAASR